MGHYRLAAHDHFADALGVLIARADFHSANGSADGVGTEWLLIIQRDRGARFRASVAVVNRNPQIVKERDGRGFGERAAHQQRAKAAAEGLMNVLEKRAAESEGGAA